ncbi:MAG: glucose-6-phosphate isomerase [Pseudomonadales bacterium]
MNDLVRGSGPERQPAWKKLTELAARLARRPVAELLDDQERNQALRIDVAGLSLDFTKQRLNHEALTTLTTLARQQQLPARIEQLFAGAALNTSENRPALHTALRAGPGDAPEHAGRVVAETLARLQRFAADVLAGRRCGSSGRAFTDLVHIGIGGSHLGPELVVDALQARGRGLRCHFVANVDGDVLTRELSGLDPETTLFVVVSKSFATLETRENALAARSWFLERTASTDALAEHFVAVTANVAAAGEFGIAEPMIYPLWDWVGGRFSLWSAVGMPIALAAGPEAFAGLLEGARHMDQHFRHAPLLENAPALLALTGIWNFNFLGAGTLAVLPYASRLRLLPDYLQQLEMESNGKSVQHDGSPVGVHSMGIVWGGEGTNGQHAFHQLLHQGTRSFAADFIVIAHRDHDLEDHHRWLLANALAQSQAMMAGQDSNDAHRRVSGDKATTTIVMERLEPSTLGALLALYEHKVFCQGVIWNINSFDQWGVEVGKRLALPIHAQLAGAQTVNQDASTRYLVEHLRSPDRTGP